MIKLQDELHQLEPDDMIRHGIKYLDPFMLYGPLN
jgi:hypothetical protein